MANYTVKKGQTLNTIAKELGFKDYKAAGLTGYGSNPDIIKIGQVLSYGTPETTQTTTNTSNVPTSTNINDITNQPQITVPTDTSTNPYAGLSTGATSYVTANDAYAKALTDLGALDTSSVLPGLENQYQVSQKAEEARRLKAQITANSAQAAAAQQELERQAGTGKDITSTFLGRQQQEISRQEAIRNLPLTAEYQAAQGDYQAAQDTVNKLYTAQVADATNKYNYKLKVFEAIKEGATAKEKALLEAAEKKEQRTFEEEKQKVAFENAKELAKYNAQLDAQDPYKIAQTKKILDEIKASGSDVNSFVNVNDLPPSTKDTTTQNTDALTAIIRASKIGQGTKTSLANLLGVIASAEDMANAAVDGKFSGLSPLRALTDIEIPFTDIKALPFRQAGKREKTIQNETYINGINLRTQVWASGAALTEQQTKQVEAMTPKVTDTDAQVKTKLNELSNFMLGQARSVLQSEGIQFVPKKINLFETQDKIEMLSEEQKKTLKDEGLI